MTAKNITSESLNLLRFPLAVVVVAIHIFSSKGITLHGKQISFDSAPIFQEINYFIDGFLRGQSVPIYFFISGYMFFLGITLTRETYKRKLKNRIKTLLIPYLVWNTLAILFVLWRFLPFFKPLFPNMADMNLNFSLSAILDSYWDNCHGIFVSEPRASCMPVNVPLWFIRDLMIVVVFTPVLYWLLLHIRHYFVCLLGLAWFVMAYCNIGHLNMLITAFFFFAWGGYVSVTQKDMLVEFGKFSKLSAILYMMLSMLYVASIHWFPEFTTTIKQMNIFVGLLFAYNFAAWLLRRKICRPNAFLASASFFIYITHWLVCQDIVKMTFLIIHPISDIGLIVTYFFALILCVCSLLLIFWILRKYSSHLLMIITGRKIIIR